MANIINILRKLIRLYILFYVRGRFQSLLFIWIQSLEILFKLSHKLCNYVTFNNMIKIFFGVQYIKKNYKMSCLLLPFQVTVIWVSRETCFLSLGIKKSNKIRNFESHTLTLLSHYWTCLKSEAELPRFNIHNLYYKMKHLFTFRVTAQWRVPETRSGWLWTISRGGPITAGPGGSAGATATSTAPTSPGTRAGRTGTGAASKNRAPRLKT